MPVERLPGGIGAGALAMDRALPSPVRGLLVAIACALPALTGCNAIALVGAAAGLDQIPAECKHLEGKRVAVVCVASSSSTGGTIASRELVDQFEQVLRAKVPGIELVPQPEIEDWKDNHDWDQLDFRQVGKGVKAERVLAINIKSFNLYSGASMYRGRTELDLQVFDMEGKGKVAWRKDVPEVQFPIHGEDAVMSKKESQFRREFLGYLSAKLGRHFHAYDPHEDFADDLKYISK